MTILVLNQAKNVQKLKNLPKTQGEISKNLKFPANPLPYVCRKIVLKKPGLSITWKDPGVDDEFRGLPPCGVARLAPEAAAAAAPPPGGGDGVRIDDDLGNRKWLPPVKILIEN